MKSGTLVPVLKTEKFIDSRGGRISTSFREIQRGVVTGRRRTGSEEIKGSDRLYFCRRREKGK